MDMLKTLFLAFLVFLALPLPLFASAALRICPAARTLVLPWVRGNSFALAASGLFIVATSLPPWIAFAVGGLAFLACGTHMSSSLARVAGSPSVATARIIGDGSGFRCENCSRPRLSGSRPGT